MVRNYTISKYTDDTERLALSFSGGATVMPEFELSCVNLLGETNKINLTYYEAERLHSALAEIFHDNMKVRWHFESDPSEDPS